MKKFYFFRTPSWFPVSVGLLRLVFWFVAKNQFLLFRSGILPWIVFILHFRCIWKLLVSCWAAVEANLRQCHFYRLFVHIDLFWRWAHKYSRIKLVKADRDLQRSCISLRYAKVLLAKLFLRISIDRRSVICN